MILYVTVTIATYQLTPVWEFLGFHSSVVEDSVLLGYDADSLLHTSEDKALQSFENSGTDHPDGILRSLWVELHLYLRGVSVRHVNTNSGIHYPMASGDKPAGALGLSFTYIYDRGLECVDLYACVPYTTSWSSSRQFWNFTQPIQPTNQCRETYFVSEILLRSGHTERGLPQRTAVSVRCGMRSLSAAECYILSRLF